MNRIEGGIAEGKQILDAHVADKNNPHGVTPAQIGAETPAAAQTKVDAHANKTTAAHKASAISIDDTGNRFAATEVEGALAEIAAQQAQLFISVDNGKAEVAAAVVAKGGTVAGTAPYTFRELTDGVNSITTKLFASGSGSATHAANTSPSRQFITGLSFAPTSVIVVLKHQNAMYDAPDIIAIRGFTALTPNGQNMTQSSGQGKHSYGAVMLTLQAGGFYFDTTLTAAGSSILADSTTYKWWAIK